MGAIRIGVADDTGCSKSLFCHTFPGIWSLQATVLLIRVIQGQYPTASDAASSFWCGFFLFLNGKTVTSSLADSPLGAADGPRRPCFNHSKTEVRRSPPRADRRARPCPFPYAALKSRTALHPPRAQALVLSLPQFTLPLSRIHGRRVSTPVRRPISRAPLHGFQIHRTQSSTISLAPSSTPPTTATTPTSPGISDSPAVSSSFTQTRPHRGTPSFGHRFFRPRDQIDYK